MNRTGTYSQRFAASARAASIIVMTPSLSASQRIELLALIESTVSRIRSLHVSRDYYERRGFGAFAEQASTAELTAQVAEVAHYMNGKTDPTHPARPVAVQGAYRPLRTALEKRLARLRLFQTLHDERLQTLACEIEESFLAACEIILGCALDPGETLFDTLERLPARWSELAQCQVTLVSSLLTGSTPQTVEESLHAINRAVCRTLAFLARLAEAARW